MLVRYGCGCVYLITKVIARQTLIAEEFTSVIEPTHGRLIEYCGGSTDSHIDPFIGNEVKISDQIRLENIASAYTLTAEQADKMFERLRDLVLKGHRYNDLRSSFKTLLGD